MRLFNMITSIVPVLIPALPLVLVRGQDEPHWVQLDGEGKVWLSWSVVEDLITFELTAATIGFVGFGISPNGGMTGADIFVGGVHDNGSAYHQDLYGVAPTAPYPDDHDDWNLHEASENGTHTYLKMSRLLNTCDEQDYPIGVDTNRLIWALGTTDSLEYHEERKGTKSIFLLGAANPDVDLSAFERHDMTIDMEMPQEDTAYWCSFHRGPLLHEKHQIVAFDAILTSQLALEHTHHFILFNCYAPSNSNSTLEELIGNYTVDQGYPGNYCYGSQSSRQRNYCQEYLYVWAKGGEKMVFPEHVGYPIGEGEQQGESAFYMLEIHYDNPRRDSGVKFKTGVSFYYTNEIREEDAGIMTVGHDVYPTYHIPPNIDDFVVVGHCGGECTSRRFPEDGIQVFNSLLHAHLSGRKIKLRQFRNGEELPWLDFDNHYDFNYQLNKPLSEWRTVMPGDHLTYECTYSTVWKYPNVVIAGLGTRDEMCESFLWYYPKIDIDFCGSRYGLTTAIREFGATNFQTTNHPVGIQTITITAPPELAGDLEEVLNTKFNWTEEFKRELESLRRYGEHDGLCRSRAGAVGPITFRIKYPDYDKDYAPADQCESYESFCVDKADGLYPHPADCTMYIICAGFQTSIHKCPEGTFFDPITSTCRPDVSC